MISIRVAIPEDIKAIIDFQKKMAWETEQISLVPDEITNGVNAVFSNPSLGRYYVAEDDKKIIASLLITFEWSDWRNAPVWWFQSVYVLPHCRRKGVFTKMYNHVRDEAVKEGTAGLRLYVEKKNHVAQKTYKALGMNSEHYSLYEWLRNN